MYNVGICDDGDNICISIENMLLQYAQEKNIQIDTNVWYTGESLRDYLASAGGKCCHSGLQESRPYQGESGFV